MVPQIDHPVRESLTDFVTDLFARGWKGREYEAVSLYALGYLQRHFSPGSPLYDPAQIGLEVCVPGVATHNPKGRVNKDLVIWPAPAMTTWDATWQVVNHPLAIMEWKVFQPKSARAKMSAYDIDWMEAFASTRGLSVTSFRSTYSSETTASASAESPTARRQRNGSGSKSFPPSEPPRQIVRECRTAHAGFACTSALRRRISDRSSGVAPVPTEHSMAKFLTTHGIGYYIEEVIRGAQRELTLITPYLQLSPVLLDRLKDADRRRVQVRIVYGKNKLKAEEHAKLAELERLALFYLENLHAKCYANDELAVVGSMNMYQFSEKTNREMGGLLSRNEDASAFADARREMESIVAAAEVRAPKVANTPRRPAARASEARSRPQGYCIRCSSRITYQPEAPLCSDCYRTWAAWGNEEFEEKCCHRCGTSGPMSKARPLCSRCFREDPFTARIYGRV